GSARMGRRQAGTRGIVSGRRQLRGPAIRPSVLASARTVVLPGRSAPLVPSFEGRLARRDLALAALAATGLSRLLDGSLVWLVAAIVLAAVMVAALQVLAEE